MVPKISISVTKPIKRNVRDYNCLGNLVFQDFAPLCNLPKKDLIPFRFLEISQFLKVQLQPLRNDS